MHNVEFYALDTAGQCGEEGGEGSIGRGFLAQNGLNEHIFMGP